MGADENTPRRTIFFHPDCTVGPGVSPGHAFRLAGFTAGGESHPALKIPVQLLSIYAARTQKSTPYPTKGITLLGYQR